MAACMLFAAIYKPFFFAATDLTCHLTKYGERNSKIV